MKLLVDVDALGKLAHWRLLDELPSLTGVPYDQCATLTSAKYRAQRAVVAPDGRLFRTSEVARVALTAIESMRSPVDPAEDLLPILQDVPNIDAGEAVLLSATVKSEGIRLLTGDKRALRALTELPALDRKRFAGKIIIIEQILLVALDRHGIDWLRQRVCPHKDIDKAVGIAMGSRCDAPESAVRQGLQSYIGEIARSCTPSLIADIR